MLIGDLLDAVLARQPTDPVREGAPEASHPFEKYDVSKRSKPSLPR
jgi:hypothetical protein